MGPEEEGRTDIEHPPHDDSTETWPDVNRASEERDVGRESPPHESGRDPREID